jgi:hypothetical protein
MGGLATGRTDQKRDEPHDWQRDATSPRLSGPARVSSAPKGRAAEKTGEVVQNHEVGTGLLAWYARGRRCDGDIAPGVDAGELVDEGAIRSDDTRIGQRCTKQVPDRTNPMRGRLVYRPGRDSEALKGSEDHWRCDSKISHREMSERRRRREVGTLEGPPGDWQGRGGRGERPGTRSDSALVMRRTTKVALPRQDP